MSKIVGVYEGIAKDMETIIRLKPWIIDEITTELGKIDVEVAECRFKWSYDPKIEHFRYSVDAIA